VDFGAGDGTYAYRLAKARPDTLVLATDANLDAMAEISQRASAKPRKGGLTNAFFGRIALDESPGDLEHFADSLSVILPWGTLLAAVAHPKASLLARLFSLLKPGGTFEILFGYSECADGVMVKNHRLSPIDDTQLRALERSYRDVALSVKVRQASNYEVRLVPSTWAKKLSYGGKTRTFVRITGVVPVSSCETKK